jgi:hypothetical protein
MIAQRTVTAWYFLFLGGLLIVGARIHQFRYHIDKSELWALRQYFSIYFVAVLLLFVGLILSESRPND